MKNINAVFLNALFLAASVVSYSQGQVKVLVNNNQVDFSQRINVKATDDISIVYTFTGIVPKSFEKFKIKACSVAYRERNNQQQVQEQKLPPKSDQYDINETQEIEGKVKDNTLTFTFMVQSYNHCTSSNFKVWIYKASIKFFRIN